MVDFIVALIALISIECGHAAHYAPGVMEDVIAVRLAGWTAGNLTQDDVQGVIGFVAVADCSEIGRRVWLFHESEGWRGPYLVADCANRVEGHDKRMERLGIVVEVDYNTARRWGVVGLAPEEIHVAIIAGWRVAEEEVAKEKEGPTPKGWANRPLSYGEKRYQLGKPENSSRNGTEQARGSRGRPGKLQGPR